MRLLLCCKKTKPYLYRQDDDTFKLENKIVNEDISDYKKYYGLNNGKIVIECDFEVEKIIPIDVSEDDYTYGLSSGKGLLKESCLSTYDICEYLEDYNGETIFKKGYAIHIKNLHIFDKPKELSDFNKIIETPYGDEPDAIITKISNMMRCCWVEYRFGTFLEPVCRSRILIPVSPQEMCRIANKQQAILIRKKVLKEMLNND